MPEPRITIRPITAAQTVPLRHEVLWPDKPQSYVLLPEDESGHHFGAFVSPTSASDPDESSPVAVISVFEEPVPLTAGPTNYAPLPDGVFSTKAARFRKFACAPAYQNQGIGTALLAHVFAVAKQDLGCHAIWCDARLSSAPWYERRGMRMFGEHFWKGDIEYVKMVKILNEREE
ncbi:GCN5-related N-acetyltransferase [Panus rudis PR-1116 ss-1]|nr:GCN5-related N-acetyltransferase [Panus rudis PR-1116 ss-1]